MCVKCDAEEARQDELNALIDRELLAAEIERELGGVITLPHPIPYPRAESAPDF